MHDSFEYASLVYYIQRFHGVLVAFSGGVDSALVLAAAIQALGKTRVIAVTADSPSLPRRELLACRALASKLGAQHQVLSTQELDIAGYRKNDGNRCYYCKGELYLKMAQMPEYLDGHVILNGANVDDLGDWRPGMRAAKEAGVISPLLECGIGKDTVRSMACDLRLEVWDKPASPCLSSRIPYHTPVTRHSLRLIEAAEDYLKDRGFRDVRVRYYGTLARIEVPRDQIVVLMDHLVHAQLVNKFRRLGFEDIEIDPEGLISGKLNRQLEPSTL